MSKYTTQVRFICETACALKQSVGFDDVNETIKNSIPTVFNFDFPIFDEAYREVLLTKILKHYYTREIGLETVGLWKLKLDARLNEIMPYYNQLYKSELLEFNPLYDVDLTTDHKLTKAETENQKAIANTKASSNSDATTRQDASDTSTLHNESENTGNTTANNRKTKYDKYSETPQGSLVNVQNDRYLTNARMIEDTEANQGTNNTRGSDDSNSSSSSESSIRAEESARNNMDLTNTTDRNINTLNDYVQHVKGKTAGASYASLLKDFRSTFMNIDLLIITELSDLFFNLW